MYVNTPEVLAMYGDIRPFHRFSHGLRLGVSHFLLVYEGNNLPQSGLGYEPTSFKKILKRSFTTTVKREIVRDRGRTGEPLCRDIMEELCYIALVFLEQEITTTTASELIDD